MLSVIYIIDNTKKIKKRDDEKMVKYFITDDSKQDGFDDQNYRQYLRYSKMEETLYAEFACYEDGKPTFDTLELATDLEGIRKIRDWLTHCLNNGGM